MLRDTQKLDRINAIAPSGFYSSNTPGMRPAILAITPHGVGKRELIFVKFFEDFRQMSVCLLGDISSA
ncbi:hypothetical protein DJ564_14450 [Pseudomonas sp. 31-12]|nr:hypothetical protein DJ564_14450 [Pseudomonas sp. 31-12]